MNTKNLPSSGDIRNARGHRAPTVSDVAFRRDPSNAIKKAIRHGTVVITKDDKPSAVMVTPEDFISLVFGLTGRRLAKRTTKKRVTRRRAR